MDFFTIIGLCVTLSVFINIIGGFMTYYACKKFALKVQAQLEFKIKTEQIYLNKVKQNVEQYLKESFRSQRKEHKLVKNLMKK